MKQIPVRHINSDRQQPDLIGNFSIRDLEALLNGENLVQELHRHDFFLVLAVKNGTGDHSIDFTCYTVGDYTIFLMRPGQVHQLSLYKGTTGYLMQFRLDFYTSHDTVGLQFLRKACRLNFFQLSNSVFGKLLDLLAYIYHEAACKAGNYQEVIKANMNIFFIELLRHIENIGDKAGNYRQEQLEAFIALLENHVFTHKQVTQYASMLNLSPYQLNTIVKETLGKTSSELINEQIILEARRQLLATANQVTQIAYSLGYEDVSYFIRFFKKHTGYPPDVFRHNFK